ncbi:RNA polymerase sigma factor [Flagellimonas crocea]|uniref:RNA polymerase sigma factor n=1 Tax=Flagellimonas crocea TaxID=3067311 RepID=UPI00296EC1FB|nr:RNA polymerase sigma-70 factor [Muricauda sp. DH64]
MNEYNCEKKLSQGIIEGDEAAFKAFFEKYNRPLFGYVASMTKDHEQAKDIVQMSFVSLWKRRKTFEPTNFKPLLFTMAKNLFIDEYRSTMSRANLYAELSFDAIQDEPVDYEHTQQQVCKLKKVIETLPKRCRDILIMTKIEGLTQQEVADHLGISVRTVEAQIRIAYTKIRETFETEDSIILFVLMGALHQLYPNSIDIERHR